MPLTKKRGMVSIEALLVLPLVCSVILLFMNIMVFTLAKNRIEASLYKSSYFFYDYSYIFHEKGLLSLENRLLEVFNKKVIGQGESALIKAIDGRYILEAADDIIYRQIAKEVFFYYLSQEDSYSNKLINFDYIKFDESKFFNRGDRVHLKVKARLKPLFPLLEKIIIPFEINEEIYFRAFSKGDMPSIVANEEEGESVWALAPFTRGEIIRAAFGANLPFNYPVVAIYEGGKVSMIKSLDHTCPSYQTRENLVNTVKRMINDLSSFNGRDYAGVNIEAKDIRARELILVIPENPMSQSQEIAMMEIRNYSFIKNIQLNIKAYQYKDLD